MLFFCQIILFAVIAAFWKVKAWLHAASERASWLGQLLESSYWHRVTAYWHMPVGLLLACQ